MSLQIVISVINANIQIIYELSIIIAENFNKSLQKWLPYIIYSKKDVGDRQHPRLYIFLGMYETVVPRLPPTT